MINERVLAVHSASFNKVRILFLRKDGKRDIGKQLTISAIPPFTLSTNLTEDRGMEKGFVSFKGCFNDVIFFWQFHNLPILVYLNNSYQKYKFLWQESVSLFVSRQWFCSLVCKSLKVACHKLRIYTHRFSPVFAFLCGQNSSARSRLHRPCGVSAASAQP